MTKKKEKLKPSKKTKKAFKNNLSIFSLIMAVITVILVELIYILFFEGFGFGIESIYLIYIVPVLLFMITPLIHIVFKKYFDNFAMIEKSLSRVADGDFSTRIEVGKSGPFEESFNNFNKMVAELENNKVLKDDFINNFSHEFKTPIASIKGFADLVLEEELSKEDETKYLKIISMEAERLQHLSESALFISKIASDTIMKDKKLFNLGEQIKNCVAVLDKQISDKKIEIVADIEDVKIYSSGELLQEVWLNILNNAVKFSNNGGKIDISLVNENGYGIAKIRDYGIGMTEEEQSKIFNQYYQADTSHKSSGFGLGLSIAKRLVSLAGGKIKVSSKPKEGAEFTVILPLGI